MKYSTIGLSLQRPFLIEVNGWRHGFGLTANAQYYNRSRLGAISEPCRQCDTSECSLEVIDYHYRDCIDHLLTELRITFRWMKPILPKNVWVV